MSILVDEPGHALSVRDIEHALGVPVVAVVSFDPAIARAVDAGLLAEPAPTRASAASSEGGA